MKSLPLFATIALALGAVHTGVARAHEDGSVSKVFGAIHVKAGGQLDSGETVNGAIDVGANARTGDLETVNGAIDIDNGAQTGELETVNGAIDVGDNAVIKSAEAVNGAIDIGVGSRVLQHIETVNGAIEIAARSEVLGEVENVNGTIRIEQAHVVGRVSTATGDITLLGARLDNGLLVEKQGWSLFNFSRKPVIKIGAGSVVNGTLEFRREVELFVHPTARIGKVIGASAKPLN